MRREWILENIVMLYSIFKLILIAEILYFYIYRHEAVTLMNVIFTILSAAAMEFVIILCAKICISTLEVVHYD